MLNNSKLHLITLVSLNNHIIGTLYMLNFQKRSCSIYEFKKRTIFLRLPKNEFKHVKVNKLELNIEQQWHIKTSMITIR